jgi:amino acid adenylation domain-containing protein
VPLDASYPAERLRLMTEDAGLSAVVAEAGIELPAELNRLPVVWVEGCSGRFVDAAGEEKQAAVAPRRKVTADNLAYVIYTSGSTGRPKGVQITHRSAVAFIHWATNMFSPSDLRGVLASTSLSFDLSVFELFVTLNSGGKIVLVDNILALQDCKTACEVTLINTVPSAITELLRSGAVPNTVRTINLAGEALPRSLVENLYCQTDVQKVWNLYGPSEDTTYSTFEQLDRDELGPVLIGRPIANTRAYVCDPWLRPAGVGVAGELLLGGEGLARGYLGRPGLTAERFIPNPFAAGSGERLYRTGDLVRYLADGRLEYLGRLDQQVKVRGYRIEPGEIEAELGRHEGVRASCVVARGEGSERQLVAYVVAAAEQWEQLREELREQLRGRLPAYMAPTRYVRLDELPLTLNGKLDRHALPEPEGEEPERGQVGPRTAVEELIAGIWSEVLRVEQVGVEADFFELGGHSLLATRVMIRIREGLGVEAPLRSIFEHRTVAALARHIESLRLAQVPSAPAIRHAPEIAPVLSIEQETCLLREWWEGLHGLEPRPFHLATALNVRGDLDVAALERAINDVARRHDVLQSSFPTAPGLLFFKPLNAVLKRILTLCWVQKRLKAYSAKEATEPSRRPRVIGGPFLRIRGDKKIIVPLVDLRETAAAEREAESIRLMLETARQTFDYGRGPLLRVLVVRLGEAEFRVCLVMHHLVSDAWSLNVCLKELTALYDMHATGKPAHFLELPAQYADYARWQRELLRGETFHNLLTYWRPRLAAIDFFPQAKLPFTIEEPASADFQKRPEQYSLTLTPETSNAIRSLSSRSGCTLFICLLAALKAVIHHYSGEERIAILAPFANRLRSETQNMIGWFATGHALITSVSGDPQFSQLMAQVKEVVLGASTHQEVPGPFLTRLFMHEIQDEKLLKRKFTLPYVFFDFKARAPQLSMEGLALEPVELPPISAGPGLGVTVSERNDSLCLNILFSPEKFEKSGVRKMLADYGLLLEIVSANPAIRLSEISLPS